MDQQVQTNSRLVSRVRSALGVSERCLFVTKRDAIVILRPLIRALFLTLEIALFAFTVSNFGLTGVFGNLVDIAVRACILAIVIVWIYFFAVPFLNWEYEVLAITQTARGDYKAYYRRGMWLRSILPLSLKNLMTTPIRQNRARYQVATRTGDLKLSVMDDEDIKFLDAPDINRIAQFINSLI